MDFVVTEPKSSDVPLPYPPQAINDLSLTCICMRKLNPCRTIMKIEIDPRFHCCDEWFAERQILLEVQSYAAKQIKN